MYWAVILLALNACSNVGDSKFPKTTPVDGSTSQALSSVVSQSSSTTALTGVVTQVAPCAGTNAKITLRSGGYTIYESVSTIGANFEFHINPGEYQIAVAGSDGCSFQTNATAIAGQVLRINVSLRSGATISAGATATPTGSGSSAGTPCAWTGYGCSGAAYPGTGGAVIGKPNVYLSGPVGMDFEIQTRFSDGSNLLAAIPAMGLIGWKGKIDQRSRVYVDSVSHDYLFYDARTDVDRLQSREGFCRLKEELIPSLIQSLQDFGFEPNEIRDFREYWSRFMPNAKSYCVYPQLNEDVARIADLQIRPTPDKLTRVWYFIVPQDVAGEVAAYRKRELKIASREKRFFQKESSQFWNKTIARGGPILKLPSRVISSQNTPVSIPFMIREWGVGFLAR